MSRSFKSPANPAGGSGRATTTLDREPLPIPPPKSAPPSAGKLWLVNVGAFLFVSVFTLLFFYYVVAWFSKAGNFLRLPLPFLPAKKPPVVPGPQKVGQHVPTDLGQPVAMLTRTTART